MKNILKVVLLGMVLFVLQPFVTTSANQFTVTPGVEYKKGASHWKGKSQSIHTVEVDVNRPEVTVDAIIPNPLNARARLTNLLKANSSEGNRVVAGINASFFHTSNGAPAYLLSSKGKVNTYGVISTGNTEYMSVPTAFGMDKNGKGIIGKFGYEAKATIGGVPIDISNVNKVRETGETVLYTPSYSFNSTRASEYGIEFVITNLSSPIEEGYELGKEVKGKVASVTPYGSRDSKIPPNGVVISIQGGAKADAFKNIKAGDEVSLTVDFEKPWKDAQFMLASGPLLVKDGKVDMTINPNSSRAKSIHPRTAVAVNKDGSKVFLVTVDGRRAGSRGMNLTEFSEYLISIGAHAALNLDGGGSTAMAVRKRGDIYPTLYNQPSDNVERAISAAIGAVSLTKTSAATSMEAELTGTSSLLVGGTTSIKVKSGLDTYFNPVPINNAAIKYAVEGDIGTISSTGVFTAKKPGKGSIVAQFGNAKKSYPIEVLAEPTSLRLIGGDSSVGANDQVQFSVKAYDAAGKELMFSDEIVQWSVSPELGTINNKGLLKTKGSGEGRVSVKMGAKSASKVMKIMSGGKLVHSFESASSWTKDAARANTNISFEGTKSPYKDGKTSLKLAYDFTGHKEGTSASYAVAKQPIKMSIKPTSLGLWVYGDGASHWLRGQITDQNGKTHTIDFTENGGLNWTGWKYVKATIPNNVVGEISLNRIYIAEPNASKKNRGAIYLDRLIAEYGDTHKEPLFNDVPLSHRAAEDIAYAVDKGWILGDIDGKFNPNNSISRAHAAVLISRVLNLSSDGKTNFTDVPSTHRYAKEIAAVVEAGIMSGNSATTFNPNGKLTRAHMAKVLVNSYDLKADPSQYEILKDVPKDHWAFDDIHVLRANGVTVISDGMYRPFEDVKRYQIAAFLTRIDKK